MDKKIPMLRSGSAAGGGYGCPEAVGSWDRADSSLMVESVPSICERGKAAAALGTRVHQQEPRPATGTDQVADCASGGESGLTGAATGALGSTRAAAAAAVLGGGGGVASSTWLCSRPVLSPGGLRVLCLCEEAEELGGLAMMVCCIYFFSPNKSFRAASRLTRRFRAVKTQNMLIEFLHILLYSAVQQQQYCYLYKGGTYVYTVHGTE